MERASNPEQAIHRLEMMSMAPMVRSMTMQAVALRRAAAQASDRVERRALDDEASDLFDQVYVYLNREQPKGWVEVADAVDDVDCLTAVRRR